MRPHIAVSLLLLVVLTSAARPLALAQAQAPAPPPIVGEWRGAVTAGDRQMNIVLTVKVQEGALQAEINTAHGIFRVTKVSQADGKWVLPFETGDGLKGTMSGTITDNVFSGDWDLRPMAVGTFEVRKK